MNGSLGEVVDFVKKESGIVHAIIVKFDDVNAGQNWIQKHKSECYKWSGENGVPIFKHSQRYQIPNAHGARNHGKMSRCAQFPLRLAWASTAHKVQGLTVKVPTKLIIHGCKMIPDAMLYTMLSRAQTLEQVYVDNFNGIIKANPHSLDENSKLIKKSIVPMFGENTIFMINIPTTFSQKNKWKFITNDIYAIKADHICVIESSLVANEMDDRYVHSY